jgi:hypothetical protein
VISCRVLGPVAFGKSDARAVACVAVRRAGDEVLRERAVAQLEAGDLVQRLLAHGGDGAGAPPGRTATSSQKGRAGVAGLAEEEGRGGGGGRGGGLPPGEESRVVEMVVRCGRLGLWREARAVYDSCAAVTASVERLQSALLARV